MPNTVFPFKSDKPEMRVTLPVGTHVLELVVIDSSDVESPPVTVVVIVEPDTGKGPIIDDFGPKWLGLGEQADPFVIKGWRLRRENETGQEPAKENKVAFLPEADDTPDPNITNITATIKPESTANTLELVVKVDGQAREGNYHLQVTTPFGNHVADGMFVVKKQ